MGWGTYGSRTTAVGGAALVLATRKIKEKAKIIAAHLLEAAVEDMDYADGKFFVKGSPDKAKTIQDIALMAQRRLEHAGGRRGRARGVELLRSAELHLPVRRARRASSRSIPRPGTSTLKRYVAVDDCGPQINPVIVEGQVHGGVVQGVGQALWEEAVYDDNGQLVTGSMLDYALPRADRLPDIEVLSTVTPSPHHPLGRQGHRRGRHDRVDRRRLQRRDRRARAVRRRQDRDADDPGARLARDPTRGGKAMYASSFDYFRAKSLAEASQLLKKHKGARLLAGGHSLLPAMKFQLATPKALVDLAGIKGLSGIKAKGKAIEIGATTTHAEIAASPVLRKACPILAEAAAQIGDLQVRNRGTIGGSIAHADPAADFPTVLVALGATIAAKGPKGARKIAAEKFFVDLFTTALKPGEIVTSVVVPAYGKGTGAAYLKHPHPASRYAVVGVAAIVEVKDGKVVRASLVVGGTTPNPVRAAVAEAALMGQKPDTAVIAAAAGKVAAAIEDPLSDTYASGEFRVHLATVMAKRALATAAERARA